MIASLAISQAEQIVREAWRLKPEHTPLDAPASSAAGGASLW